jgi:Fic family protein
MYQPKFRITPYFLGLIDQAAKLREEIESATVQVGWLPALQSHSFCRLTHSSAAIEGNPLSLPQVENLLAKGKPGAQNSAEIEVKNYSRALRFAQRHAAQKISEPVIQRLHKMLTQNLLPKDQCGKYRKKQNYVVNENGVKIYTPPPPAQAPHLMQELIEWINLPETKKLHSVILAAIIHHCFVSIHPFIDGNGRLARLLGNWILYQSNFDRRRILTIDDFFAADRAKYYQKIQQARELDNDLTYWLDYVAEAAVSALKSLQKRIAGLKISAKSKIVLSARQEELINLLQANPNIASTKLQKQLKLTRARIHQIIQPLIAAGLVEKTGQSRATRYRIKSI